MNTREKILFCALELFANQGFSKTSTRQIAQHAGVNLSAIKYYFGDKQGLYSAAFNEPMGEDRKKELAQFFSEKSLQKGLELFFIHFLAPLTQNAHIQLCVKLHMREILEPTGMRNQEIEGDIVPHHRALVDILKKEFSSFYSPTIENHALEDALDRLAFSIVSMAIFLYVGHDIVTKINTRLMESESALITWAQTMSLYAIAMIETEKKLHLL